MATKYYDPNLGTGADDGSSQANAWQTFQKAADGAVQGDTVLCKTGTETLAAIVDMDTNAGDTDTPIKFIGVNSSWVNDGTKVIIDANNAVLYCLGFSGSALDGIWFENFKFINATNSGINDNVAGGNIRTYLNCEFNNNGNYGIYAIRGFVRFIKCTASNNTAGGFGIGTQSAFIFCKAIGNGRGFQGVSGGCLYYGCIAHNNTNDGILNPYSSSVINCVLDGNGRDGIRGDYGFLWTLIGNRLTNNSGYGLNLTIAGYAVHEDYNFYLNNTSGDKNASAGATVFDLGNSLSAGTEGYTDRANDDFNLTSTATLRRIAIEIGGITP